MVWAHWLVRTNINRTRKQLQHCENKTPQWPSALTAAIWRIFWQGGKTTTERQQDTLLREGCPNSARKCNNCAQPGTGPMQLAGPQMSTASLCSLCGQWSSSACWALFGAPSRLPLCNRPPPLMPRPLRLCSALGYPLRSSPKCSRVSRHRPCQSQS